jgi:hypothetical protein
MTGSTARVNKDVENVTTPTTFSRRFIRFLHVMAASAEPRALLAHAAMGAQPKPPHEGS